MLPGKNRNGDGSQPERPRERDPSDHRDRTADRDASERSERSPIMINFDIPDSARAQSERLVRERIQTQFDDYDVGVEASSQLPGPQATMWPTAIQTPTFQPTPPTTDKSNSKSAFTGPTSSSASASFFGSSKAPGSHTSPGQRRTVTKTFTQATNKVMHAPEHEKKQPWERWNAAGVGKATAAALRCRIHRTSDVLWQDNPARVLKYRSSHLHYWGYIPGLIPRNLRATIFNNIYLHIQTLVLLGWCFTCHMTGLGVNIDDTNAYVDLFSMSYMGAKFNLNQMVVFILGLFVTLTINRWSNIRKMYGDLHGTVIDMLITATTVMRRPASVVPAATRGTRNPETPNPELLLTNERTNELAPT
jgi:hypothetical protein